MCRSEAVDAAVDPRRDDVVLALCVLGDLDDRAPDALVGGEFRHHVQHPRALGRARVSGEALWRRRGPSCRDPAGGDPCRFADLQHDEPHGEPRPGKEWARLLPEAGAHQPSVARSLVTREVPAALAAVVTLLAKLAERGDDTVVVPDARIDARDSPAVG